MTTYGHGASVGFVVVKIFFDELMEAGAFRFPQCINDRETVDFLKTIRTPEATQAIKEKPAMMIFGEADRALPKDFTIGCFKDLWPTGPVVTLPGVGHFLQEDAPETVSALIQQFVQMT